MSALVLSLYNSFDAEIEITTRQGKTFDPNSPEIQSLKKIDGIAYYTEVVEGKALLKYNDKQSIATIKGVSADFQKASGFDTLVREGVFNIQKNNSVIGRGISHILQTSPNDVFTPISVYAPKRGNTNSINPEEGLNELKTYCAGVFSINDEFDNNYVIMNIDKARELLDYTSEITSIELTLNPGINKEQIQKQMNLALGDNYEIKNREQQNALLYKTLSSEKLWTFIILVFILIIATFNVIGSLTMLIIEKKKDITILHNMGAGRKLIRRIFLIEGMLITLIGAGSGLLLGVLICWAQIRFSLIKLTEGYVVDAYPVEIRLTDILWILGAVVLIGFSAAWYPVRMFTKKHLDIT